jgi:hypothetical protein
MRELNGIKLKKLDFDLQKMGDLYSHEGPFLSHFRDERGFDYLMNWVDVNEVTNRWLLVKVSNEYLHKYFLRKLSLRQLIQANDFGVVHFLDIDSKAEHQNVWVVSTEAIPIEYRPTENSYFDIQHADRYALHLARDTRAFLSSGKDSFMKKAVRQLFGSKTKERNIFISHSINSPWSHEPNSIDEMTTVRAMYFPLLLHYHQDQHNLKLRNLLATHSQAYSNPFVCKAYLSNVRAIVTGGKAQKFVNGELNLNQIWEEVMQSTNHIVEAHPDIKPLYNDWINTLELEYDNIETIRKHLGTYKSLHKQKRRTPFRIAKKKR